MVNHAALLTVIEKVPPITVQFASETMNTATCIGRILTNVDRNQKIACKAYILPKTKLSLISCSRLGDLVFSKIITKEICKFFDQTNNDNRYGSIRRSCSEGLLVAQLIIQQANNAMNFVASRTKSRGGTSVRRRLLPQIKFGTKD